MSELEHAHDFTDEANTHLNVTRPRSQNKRFSQAGFKVENGKSLSGQIIHGETFSARKRVLLAYPEKIIIAHKLACFDFSTRLLSKNRDVTFTILQTTKNLGICRFTCHKGLGVRSKIIEFVYKAFTEIAQRSNDKTDSNKVSVVCQQRLHFASHSKQRSINFHRMIKNNPAVHRRPHHTIAH